MTNPEPNSFEQGQLDITPSTAFLHVLQNVNYKEWYALAEFVDNSIQSYLLHKEQLMSEYGEDYNLVVDIALDSATRTIKIKDNAAGIAEQDLERALRPGVKPPDTSGLSEFGMGMKNAACWFGDHWEVETKALGDPYVRSVRFDVPEIVRTETSHVQVDKRYVGAGPPYTIVTIRDARRFPILRTLGKVRSHLSSIYRRFIREGELRLLEDGRPLRYEAPQISCQPYFRTPDDEPKLWRKELNFDVGPIHVEGYAAIRHEGSTRDAGFALFRRRRLILGSEGDGYRPEQIFRNPNSYTYQRVFGELELTGIGVTYTKDGFIWPEWVDEDESEVPFDDEKWPPGLEGKFLRKLEKELNSAPVPIQDQAEGYRARRRGREARRQVAEVIDVVRAEIRDRLGAVLEAQDRTVDDDVAQRGDREAIVRMHPVHSDVLEIRWRNHQFIVTVQPSEAGPEGPWSVSNFGPSQVGGGLVSHTVAINISMNHPFVTRFIGPSGENLDTIGRMAASFAVAELLVMAGAVPEENVLAAWRENVEQLLRKVFSDDIDSGLSYGN